jgi:hypothetical protein
MFLLVARGGGGCVGLMVMYSKAWTNESTDDTCSFSPIREGTVRKRAILLCILQSLYYKDWNWNCIGKFRCFQMLNGTRGSHTRSYSIMPFDEIFIWIVHSCICITYIPLYIRTCKENFHLLFKCVSDKLFLEQIARGITSNGNTYSTKYICHPFLQIVLLTYWWGIIHALAEA